MTRAFEIVQNIMLSIVLDLLKEVCEELEEEEEPCKKRKLHKGEGQRRLQELLYSNHDSRIRAALRMNKETFYRLRDWLVQNTNLCRSKHILVEMKLAIFLAIISRPTSHRDVLELYELGLRQIRELVLIFI